MDCSSVQKVLKPFLKGLLSAGEASAVKLHLDSCQECREKYQFFNEEGRIFLDVPGPEVPSTIKKRLFDATIHRDAPFSFASILRARPFWAIAAGVFFALAILFAMSLARKPAKPASAPAPPLFVVQLVDANDTVIVEKHFKTQEEAEAFIGSLANMRDSSEPYGPAGYAVTDVTLSDYRSEPF